VLNRAVADFGAHDLAFAELAPLPASG